VTDFRTLRRHAAHYLGGRAALLLLGIVSFPLFTRLFSIQEYGVINLVLKMVVCLVVLAKLGVQNSVVRFFQESRSERESQSMQRFYSTFFFGALGLALFVGALLGVFALLAPRSVLPAYLLIPFLWATVLMLVRAQWSVLSSFFQAEGRTVLYNCFDMGIKAVTIGAICAALWLYGRTVAAYLSATVVVEISAALVAVAILISKRVLRPSAIDPKLFWAAIVFGLPLAAYEIASVVLDSGDRLLVLHYLGATQLGYYTAAYNLSSYAQVSVMAPVNLAIIPIYMRLWKEQGEGQTKAFLSRSLDYFTFAAIGLCMVGTLVSAPVMEILASAKYEPAARMLPVLIAGMMVYALHIFLTPGLLIHKKTGKLARQVVYATVLNLLLNVLLLPRMGIIGGAWATLIAYAFLVIAIGHASRPFLAVVVPWRLLAMRSLAALLAYVCGAAVLSRLLEHHRILGLVLATCLSMVAYALLLVWIDPIPRGLVLYIWRRYGTTHLASHPSGQLERL
jgi:O-antigen/teichoic acid export membrane protein